MSLLKKMIAEVNKVDESDELVALLRSSQLPTLLVERDDDVRIYSRWIEQHLFGTYRVDVLPTNGKGNLLRLYERKNEFPGLPVVFVANRGLWSFSRIPKGYEDIICTRGYSIENDVYVYSEDRIENLLDPYLKGRDKHKSVQKSISRWLAFEIEELIQQTPSESYLSLKDFISNNNFNDFELEDLISGLNLDDLVPNDNFELEDLISGLNLDDLVPKGHTELDKSFCKTRGFDWSETQITKKISREISKEHGRYLPGKLLFEMLDRFSTTSLHALYNVALTDYESKQQSFIQKIKKKLDEQGFISSKEISPAPKRQNLVPSTPLGEDLKFNIVRTHPSTPKKELDISVNYLVKILKSSRLPTIVVADEDNANIIGNLVKHHSRTVQVQPTSKRDTLLSAYERRNEFVHLPVAFVADQEMKLFTGIPKHHTNIIWTQGYNLKNDLYVDTDLEFLLEPHELWRHQQVINSTIDWFAFQVEEFTAGKPIEMDFQLSKIIPEGELKLDKRFCQHRGFRQPSPKLVQQIRDRYQFLLPGDFLFQILARFLNIRGRDFNFNIASRDLYNIALEMRSSQYQSPLYNLMQKITDQIENKQRQIAETKSSIFQRKKANSRKEYNIESKQIPNQLQKPRSKPNQPAQSLRKSGIKVGDRVNGTILKKGNIKVTVQLQTGYTEVVTFDFPNYPGKLRNKVELKVISIDNTGEIREVVPIGHKVSAMILKKNSTEVTVQLQTGYKEVIVFEHFYYPGKVGTKVKLKVIDTDNTGRVIKVAP